MINDGTGKKYVKYMFSSSGYFTDYALKVYYVELDKTLNYQDDVGEFFISKDSEISFGKNYDESWEIIKSRFGASFENLIEGDCCYPIIKTVSFLGKDWESKE